MRAAARRATPCGEVSPAAARSALQLEVVHGPDKVPEVDIEIALFTDPEGHVIGLVK
jgi:hypothetical protein